MYLHLLCFFLSVAFARGDDLPNVKSIACDEAKLPSFDKCLIITYTHDVEYSGLVKVEGFESILEGSLITKGGDLKKGTRVSVTLKGGNNALVMISDPADEELYQMKVDLETGVATKDTLPQDGKFHLNDEDNSEDRMDPQERMMWIDAYNNDRQSTMPKTFKFRIQFVADGYFKQQYGRKVNEKIVGVFNHLKTYYAHSSLQVKLDLIMLPIKHISQRIVIKADNRDVFGQIAKQMVSSGQWPDADTYILLGPKNDNGFYGIANSGWRWGHGVCSPNIERRVSINWFETDTNYSDGYQDDDLLTALTVVHETGHNLGMMHDFDDYNKKSRYDSKGKPCKDIAAFMDYVFPPYSTYNPMPSKWSGCSVDDFKAAYQKIKSIDGHYCLQSDATRCRNKDGMDPFCEKNRKYCRSSSLVIAECPKTCGQCH